VRTRQVVTIQEAIRKMTSLPAQTFGFRDRGMIREGLAADLNVFDPDTIGPAVPTGGPFTSTSLHSVTTSQL